jgi:hypothetical protein
MATASHPGRTVLFYAVLVCFAYLLVELASLAVHVAVYRKGFSFAEHTSDRRAIVAAALSGRRRELGDVPAGNPVGSVYEVLHPYLGYVQDPTRTRTYSELGFPDPGVRILPKDPNRIVIGIFGGSFAEGLSRETSDLVMGRLRASPKFAGKDIRILTLAMGGYKQPQQLLALAYLLSLGMHFDVVVSLDGLNEVALPAVDNVPKGTFPFFPRNWAVRIGSVDATMLAYERQHDRYADLRGDLARLASGAPWRYSIAVNVAWRAADGLLVRRMVEITLLATKHRSEPASMAFSARGPAISYADEGALYDDLASMWKSASVQMHALAAANGARYLHFLQPNQYLSGSKEMGREERAAAFDEQHPYRRSVEVGYPRLREKGRELAAQGVNFVDLTMAFAGRREVLYKDACCHLHGPGYNLLAARIAEEIVRRY